MSRLETVNGSTRTPSASTTVRGWSSTEKLAAANEPVLTSRRRYVEFATRV
jgi:hypothetical protein